MYDSDPLRFLNLFSPAHRCTRNLSLPTIRLTRMISGWWTPCSFTQTKSQPEVLDHRHLFFLLFCDLFEKFSLPLLEKQRGEEFDNAYYDDPAVDDEVTCTALQNYYSELPEDLLFLQGDEIKIEKKLGGGFYLVKIAWMFPALHR